MGHTLDIATAVVLQAHGTHARILDCQHGSAAGIEQGEVDQQRMRGALALAHLGQHRHTTSIGKGNAPKLDGDERQAIVMPLAAGQQLGNQLEGTIQQRRVQVQACQFVFNGSRHDQLSQHARPFHPGCGHRLVSGAVVQANRAGHCQVLLAGEVCRAGWQRRCPGVQQHTARFARQACDHVLYPVFALHQRARADAQCAIGLFHLHAHFLADLAAQQQRVVNFQLFDIDELARLVQLRHRQGQLGKACTREQYRLTHLVVGQGRVLLGIQAVFPGQRLVRYRVTQQRVHALVAQRAIGLGRDRQAEVIALPGVVRQAQRAPRHREACLPLWLHGGNLQAGYGTFQQQRTVVVALEGANHLPRLFALDQHIADVAAQNRMRAHFDEQVKAVAHQGSQRALEQHREANVLPPVLAVQAFAVQLATNNSGVERNLRSLRADMREVVDNRLLDRVHGRRVEGVVQVQATGEYLALFQGRLQQCQGVDLTGHSGAAGAVLARHHQAAVQFQFGNQLRRGLTREADRRHLPGTTGQALQAAAVVDDLGGVLQAQRAAGPGRGHFTHTVANHRHRVDAFGSQHLGNRHLQGKQRRLGDFGTCITAFAVVTQQLGAQRVARQGLEQRVHFIHGGGEQRLVEHRPAHALPLRAVAGIDKYRCRGAVQGLAGLQHCAQFAEGRVLGIVVQRLGSFGCSVANQQQAMAVRIATEHRLVGHIVIVGLRLPGQVGGKAFCGCAQAFFALGTEQ